MKKVRRSLFVGFSFAALLLAAAAAQNDVLAPSSPAASSPRVAPQRAVKPGPRPMTPAEVRDTPTTTGDLRAQPVTRQISIPFGKKPPPPPKSESDAAARAAAAAPGGVDDAEARCGAEVDEQARLACRRKLSSGVVSKP